MFEKALKIAIENGYSNINYDPSNLIPLDPTFWQALAKGLGKENIKVQIFDGGDYDADEYKDWWLYHALRYFETLISGNSEAEYWEELIK